MSPPRRLAPAPPGITGTRRNIKAENKRETSARIIKAMTAAGMTPHGWQVRSLMATLTSNREAATDQQVTEALMRAPWFPKPQVRRWRVSEGGGWAVRS